jgi:hypothetical protein
MLRSVNSGDAAERIAERGGSKLNTLLTLVIVGGLIFFGVKVVPVYVANYEFQDSINSESRFALAGYPKKSPDEIRDDVFKKVQDLGIPAKAEDIQVTIDNNNVDIGLDYSVPIDLMVYQFTLQFHPHADNHSI